GQLVDEDDLGPAGQDGVEVHLLQLDAVVEDPPPAHDRQVTQLGGGAGPAVGFHEADHDVSPAFRPPPALPEHGERLPHARPRPSTRTNCRKRTSAIGTVPLRRPSPSAVAGGPTRSATTAAGWSGAGSSPRSIRSGTDSAPRRRRASKWNGTAVTLAWGRSETSRSMASAVRSWRIRCQNPRYLRSGSSTLTSVSPSARSRATVSTAQRLSR